jgi:hypothetical protein
LEAQKHKEIFSIQQIIFNDYFEPQSYLKSADHQININRKDAEAQSLSSNQLIITSLHH